MPPIAGSRVGDGGSQVLVLWRCPSAGSSCSLSSVQGDGGSTLSRDETAGLGERLHQFDAIAERVVDVDAVEALERFVIDDVVARRRELVGEEL